MTPPAINGRSIQSKLRLLWGCRLRSGSLLYVGYFVIVSLSCTGVWKFATSIYKVTALISVKPGLYSGDADRLTKVSRADQVVRSQVALLESEHVVRSAISSVGWNDVKPSDPLEDDYADLSPLRCSQKNGIRSLLL